MTMVMIRILKTFRWEVIGLSILLFVIVINLFPQGYVILGADILQPINMAERFTSFHYEWLGRTSLFYSIFYFLDRIGISSTAQISWYLGLFLIGSYISFITFCRLVFPGVSHVIITLASLFYATNLYTLYVFTATWGYSHYQIVYIFIPVLTGLYIQSLERKKNIYFLLFLLTAFFASGSFGNPAFALSLGIYFFLLTLVLFSFRIVLFDTGTIRRIAFIICGSLLMNAYWLLPILPQLNTGIQGVYSSEFVNLTERLQKTSNAIFDTIRLLPTSEQDKYFPVNFPYGKISWLKKYTLILAFAPFLIVIWGFIYVKEKRERKFFGVFFALSLVFIVLVARVRFPFATLNSFLFQLPGLNTLRGYDKLATFTPFLLSVLLFLSLKSLVKIKHYQITLSAFFIMIILLALPFYLGGIQTKMSYILSGQKIKNYSVSKYSAIVKIPEAYIEVASLFHSDQGDYKISMLPYSPGSSVGRVNLPAWKVNGPHPAHALYERKYVELYDYYLPNWMFARDFDNTEYDPEWITDLYGLIGVKYVLYHKDAKPDSIEKMETARKYLEAIGALNKVSENSSFFLYRLDEKRLFPYVFSAKEVPFIKFEPLGISRAINNLRENILPLSYERKNPKEIIISLNSLENGEHIFLNERYDPLWVAKYVSPDGRSLWLQRDETILYANAWKTDNMLMNGKIIISYSPIRLLYMGEWITLISLLCTLFSIVIVWKKGVNR